MQYSLIAGALCGGILLLSQTSAAEETAQDAAHDTASVEGGTDGVAPQHRLKWTYPRFRLWQLIATGAVSVANVTIEATHRPFPEHRWNSGILFDEAARSAVRADTDDERKQAQFYSDLLWHPIQYFPVLDALVVPLVFDDFNLDVSLQMTALNWQALTLAFLATRISHLTVGRARPSRFGCSNEPDAEFPCTQGGPSFIGGHTSMAAAGAGLTCAHHHAFDMYGARAADTGICVLMALAAATNGYFRMRADKHWLSDIVIGYAVGGGIGFGLPWLLHYGQEEPRSLSFGLLPRNMALIPQIHEGGGGASLLGVF